MNQQRSRRFKTALNAEKEMRPRRSKAAKNAKKQKPTLLEQPKKMMDSNVITPGTQFMDLLSSALRYYIHLRMNGDPGWRGIKVTRTFLGHGSRLSFSL